MSPELEHHGCARIGQEFSAWAAEYARGGGLAEPLFGEEDDAAGGQRLTEPLVAPGSTRGDGSAMLCR